MARIWVGDGWTEERMGACYGVWMGEWMSVRVERSNDVDGLMS